MNEQQDNGRGDSRNRWLVGGYTAPVVVVLFTIFWCLMQYWLIGWRSRDWEYGTVPYVPGISIVSTSSIPTGPPPRQVELPRQTLTPGEANAER